MSELAVAKLDLMSVKLDLALAELGKTTARYEQMLAELGRTQAAMTEALAEVGSRIEAAFDLGRRYAEAANSRERHLNAVPDNI